MDKRVITCLKDTKDEKFISTSEFGFLNANSDVSFGNVENVKLFSGKVILLGNSLVSWKWHKQKYFIIFTCEAELFPVSEICKDIKWNIYLLSELKCTQFKHDDLILNADVQEVIQWIKCT